MRHHSFMRWASATMAALMFFQCTAPVAFAADDAILAESSIAVSSADSESVPADSDAGYIPEKSPENTSVDSSSNDAASSEPLTGILGLFRFARRCLVKWLSRGSAGI